MRSSPARIPFAPRLTALGGFGLAVSVIIAILVLAYQAMVGNLGN